VVGVEEEEAVESFTRDAKLVFIDQFKVVGRQIMIVPTSLLFERE
jgi:hypothetical protein